MRDLKNFVQINHKSTKRNYIRRVNVSKPKVIKIARNYSKDYWDGSRNTGYGGYKYIPGYWKNTALKLIKSYKLKDHAKILDIGCGKGFLLYELIKINPTFKIIGIDISRYAINNAKKNNNIKYFVGKAENRLNFKKNYFDLVISLGTLHNLEIFNLKKALNEISRVSKNSYVMVESYRNESEMFNLQCWALTCESFFSRKEWLWIFKEFNYKGDYEFIFFE